MAVKDGIAGVCSDLNLCHVGVSGTASAALLAHSRLGVLEELETGGGGAPILHLVDGLADEAQQVVDVLRLHEVVLRLLEEVQVRVQDLHKQVEILWFSHADLGCFESLAQLGHDLLTLLAAVAEEQMRGKADSLSLEILLEQLVAVADSVGAESLEVLRVEARERVKR